MTFLRNSQAIKKRLHQLFSTKTRGHRRVIVVAYVGSNAPRLLPDYSGVDIYCWPQIGSTDPHALAELRSPRHGARIFLSDGLHTKLYWVENVGCVITSANLSSSALGQRTLHEVGVFLEDANEIDIDSIIANLSARKLGKIELAELQRQHDLFWFKNQNRAPGSATAISSFQEWFDGDRARGWKLGWWDTSGTEAESISDFARTQFGVDEIEDYMDAEAGDYSAGDWILTYKIENNSVSKPAWMFVEFIKKLTDAEIAESPKAFSHQAVQATKGSKFNRPPFSLSDPAFKAAFTGACREYTVARLKKLSTTPSKNFLLAIRKRLR